MDFLRDCVRFFKKSWEVSITSQHRGGNSSRAVEMVRHRQQRWTTDTTRGKIFNGEIKKTQNYETRVSEEEGKRKWKILLIAFNSSMSFQWEEQQQQKASRWRLHGQLSSAKDDDQQAKSDEGRANVAVEGEKNRYRIYFHPHSPFAKLPKKGCSPCMNDTVFVDFNFIPPVLSTTTAFVDARHSLSLLLYILYIKCRKSRSCVTFSRLSTAICHILSRISRWNSSLKCKWSCRFLCQSRARKQIYFYENSLAVNAAIYTEKR